jgi:hypothetical protein
MSNDQTTPAAAPMEPATSARWRYTADVRRLGDKGRSARIGGYVTAADRADAYTDIMTTPRDPGTVLEDIRLTRLS